MSHAGSVLLLETVRATRLDRELSAALAPWRKPLARHDPAKVLLDLAVALALGGDCLPDVALLQAGPQLFGPDADVDSRRPLVVDLDATLIGAHSEKEGAAPTFKRGFGHHPLLAFADHGPGGVGEPDAACPLPWGYTPA